MRLDSKKSIPTILSLVFVGVLFVKTNGVPARVSPQTNYDTIVGEFGKNDIVESVTDDLIGREHFNKVRVLSSLTMPQDLVVFVPDRFLAPTPSQPAE